MSTEHEIITVDQEPKRKALAVVPATPADLLVYAMEKGADLAQIEKLMDLQMRWDADQARKAYVADMAEFKKNPPTIIKDKFVGYENRDGTTTGYHHATLGNVTNAIVEGLAKHGFSHRWDTEQQNALIVVTCILTHKLGHSERTMLSAGRDDSGKKNAIQQVASTITYLQRYTLLGACGLATHEQIDDDGAAGGDRDTTLADKWIADAGNAKDIADLERVWNAGASEIQKEGDDIDMAEFKNAVNMRKKALSPANPNKSSRLRNIVGAGQSAEQQP